MKDVRSGKPVIVGEVTITPLEQVARYRVINEKGFFIYLTKRPARIAVDSPAGSWDFDLTTQSTPE